MTDADERDPASGHEAVGRHDDARRPWRTLPPPVPAGASARVTARGQRAGLVTRTLANAVDVVVVVLLLAGGYAAVAAFRFLWHPASFTFPAPGLTVVLLLGVTVHGLYFAASWVVLGGTYGDELMGLRVMSSRGARLRWPRAAARAALCVLVPLGLFWVLVSSRNASLQDELLRTAVVYA